MQNGNTVHDIKTALLQTSFASGDAAEWTTFALINPVASTVDEQTFSFVPETLRHFRLFVTETFSGWQPIPREIT